MISVNQNSKLKRTVKKRAISPIYRFVFSISQENFWFQRDIGLFCDLSGILEEGILQDLEALERLDGMQSGNEIT